MPINTTAKPGVGLVLSGGGGKGAYEIGVWKALNEFGVTPNIQAISGTSVGALNSALFAQGNFELAMQTWNSISPEAVMTINDLPAYQKFASSMSDFLTGTKFFGLAQSVRSWIAKRFADQGLLSKKGLSRLIDCAIDSKSLRSFNGPVYVAAYSTSALSIKYFDLSGSLTLEEIKDRLLASASIPIVFGKTYIDGELYWDGGIPAVGDNTPVKPLYDDGYRNLIVVHLSREEPVDRRKFPDCNIIEVMPQDDLGGMITGTMNFNPECAAMNIKRGYDDAVRILSPLFKTGLALERIYHTFQEISQEQDRFSAQHKLLNETIGHTGSDIDIMLENLSKGGKI